MSSAEHQINVNHGQKTIKRPLINSKEHVVGDLPSGKGGTAGGAIETPPNISTGTYDGTRPSFEDTTVNVKPPTKNVLDLKEAEVSIEDQTDLLFHEIGGVELANLLTFGSVAGINQQFKTISNIEELRITNNPTRLLSEQAVGNGGIKDFSINLYEKLPDQDVFVSIVAAGLFMNLEIDLVNLDDGDEIEVQIVTSGNILELA